jgi:hypothetical protein
MGSSQYRFFVYYTEAQPAADHFSEVHLTYLFNW